MARKRANERQGNRVRKSEMSLHPSQDSVASSEDGKRKRANERSRARDGNQRGGRGGGRQKEGDREKERERERE